MWKILKTKLRYIKLMSEIKKISNKSKHKQIQKAIRLKKLENQLKSNIAKRKKSIKIKNG